MGKEVLRNVRGVRSGGGTEGVRRFRIGVCEYDQNGKGNYLDPRAGEEAESREQKKTGNRKVSINRGKKQGGGRLGDPLYVLQCGVKRKKGDRGGSIYKMRIQNSRGRRGRSARSKVTGWT